MKRLSTLPTLDESIRPSNTALVTPPTSQNWTSIYISTLIEMRHNQ